MTDTIDRLTAEVEAVVAKLDALAKQANNNDDEDYNDEDPSNPSMDASDDDDGNGDDDEDAVVAKALDATADVYDLASNSDADRPGELSHSDHSTWRDHVQRAVNNISRTEGCDKTEAMRRLRARRPEVLNANPVSKSAPSVTFDGLVAAEMKKGCNSEVAAQRVAQLHGYNAFNNDAGALAKAWDRSWEFQKRAEDIYGNSACSRVEALRATRLAHPTLFKRMQGPTR